MYRNLNIIPNFSNRSDIYLFIACKRMYNFYLVEVFQHYFAHLKSFLKLTEWREKKIIFVLI